jgi:hypothetical protein
MIPEDVRPEQEKIGVSPPKMPGYEPPISFASNQTNGEVVRSSWQGVDPSDPQHPRQHVHFLIAPMEALPMYRMIAGALVLAVSAACWAGEPGKPAPSKNIINGNVGPLLPSTAVEAKVQRLSEQIPWHKSLDEAKALAQKENKPIFWIHILGDLDGTC